MYIMHWGEDGILDLIIPVRETKKILRDHPEGFAPTVPLVPHHCHVVSSYKTNRTCWSEGFNLFDSLRVKVSQ